LCTFFSPDDYDTRQNEVIKTEELTYNNNSSGVSSFSHALAMLSLVIVALLWK
jgi:hypothetical protein